MDYQKKITREDTDKGVDFLKQHGMEIYQPTADEIDAFRKATKPAFETWAKKVGPDLVDLFETTIADSQGKDASGQNAASSK